MLPPPPPPPPPFCMHTFANSSAAGGPGASSVAYGDFFQLIGPFVVGSDGSLQFNRLSWATTFSLLFVDHPAPTGLSWSTKPPATQKANSVEYVAAVQEIVRRHRSDKTKRDTENNSIFLGGESYAGRFVPAIATEMLASKLPLKGILIGNGEVDPVSAFSTYGEWLFNLGYVQVRHLYSRIPAVNSLMNPCCSP